MKIICAIFGVVLALVSVSSNSADNSYQDACNKGNEASSGCYEYAANLTCIDFYHFSMSYISDTKYTTTHGTRDFIMQLMDEFVGKDCIPVTVYMARYYEGRARISKAEELYRKAAFLGHRESERTILKYERAKHRRLIDNVILVFLLVIMNFTVIIKRSWSLLLYRTLTLLPYYYIMFFGLWFVSADQEGRVRHPLLHVSTDFLAPMFFSPYFLFFITLVIIACYIWLRVTNKITSNFIILNVFVFVAANAGLMLLAFMLSGFVSYGAGK